MTATVTQQVLKTLIAGYQALLSPLLGPRCRYHPTCSDYMSQAVEQHGALRGVWFGLKRVVRCHPWAEGGNDPIPRKVISCADPPSSQAPPSSSVTSAKAES